MSDTRLLAKRMIWPETWRLASAKLTVTSIAAANRWVRASLRAAAAVGAMRSAAATRPMHMTLREKPTLGGRIGRPGEVLSNTTPTPVRRPPILA